MEQSIPRKKPTYINWVIIAMKSVKLVKFLKIFKLLKFTKVFLSFFSIMLSTLVYSFMMGPWFAIGFVALMFVHELGHVIALNHRGYKASAPIFIPMLGAAIFVPKFNNDDDEAFVGYGGPFLGAISAVFMFCLWFFWPGRPPILLVLSHVAVVLNLFNLLPIRPMDGGRITQIVSRWFKWGGLAGLIVFSLFIKQPSIMLIWILVLDDLTLNAWFKFWLGAGFLASMAALMVMGYGEQSLWMNILDCGLAGLFVFASYAVASRIIEKRIPDIPSPISLAPAALSLRLKWLSLYLVLLASLIAMMAFIHQYLPPEALPK